MEMTSLCSDAVVLRSFLLETVASATVQSLTFIISVLGSLPSAAIMLPQEPSSFNWLSIANSKKVEAPDSQCKDADGDEDDDDDDDDEEAGGEAGGEDDEGEEVNDEEGDPEDEPNANGEGVEGEGDEDDDDDGDDDGDDDDDDDDDDDGGEDEEEEDEEEEPPTKKRKGA